MSVVEKKIKTNLSLLLEPVEQKWLVTVPHDWW